MADHKSNETEHEHISTSLELEQLDVNLYRSKSLWLPTRARGVYGGQVVSQALVAATNCVDTAFSLHVSGELLSDVSYLILGPSVPPCE